MSDINWKENAVCYANSKQWVLNEGAAYSNKPIVSEDKSEFVSYEYIMLRDDFQLNEIREGDFIPVSELDTEQKYNDVVEVFGLFGINGGFGKGRSEYRSFKVLTKLRYEYKGLIHEVDGKPCFGVNFINGNVDSSCKRQIAHSQIIAIGKLKRMMLDREKSGAVSGADLTEDNADQVKNPKHYQLIEGIESIEIIARSMTKEQWKGFCLGNMLKYRIRASKKDALKQDIAKADFYGDLYEMHKEKCYD